MFVYILALGLIIAGASAATILALESLARDGRVSTYDAKGYLVIAVLVITFLVSSLAYFWGVSRFGVPQGGGGQTNGAVIGLLFTVCGCIGALGYGLTRFRGGRHLR